MCGWVKMPRDVIETELWKEVVPFRLFLFLVTQATREDGRMVNGIPLKKAQYIRAYSKLAEDLGYREGRGEKLYSKSTIKRAVDKLVKKKLILAEETSIGTLFTLLNLEEIQQGGFIDFFLTPFRETKPEPGRNEEKTEAEQNQEREKKVEKEEKEEEVPQTAYEAQPVQSETVRKIEKLTQKFIQLRQKGSNLSANDRISLENLVNLKVPEEQLLSWMEEINQQYNKGSINSMKYYETAILRKMSKKTAKKNKEKRRGETLDERFARLEGEGRLA